MNIPVHLPEKLTISLWDFSWYVRSGPGEPYEDLDRCFRELVERGYNTVRICAMPFLLFGDHELPDREKLHVSPMGGDFGQASRWYDGRVPASFDPLERLGLLFDLAREHNCFVILSSWEYQMSPSLSATPDWYEALFAVPPRERLASLAAAFSRMLSWLKDTGRFAQAAYVELHNELPNSRLWETYPPDRTRLDLLQPQTEAAIESLKSAHSDALVTVSYVTSHAQPGAESLNGAARNVDVGHVHTYPETVMAVLMRSALSFEVFVQDPQRWAKEFPGELLRSLLRDDAPPPDEHRPDAEWRLAATAVPQHVFYFFDWIDHDRADSWLESHYAEYWDATQAQLTEAIEGLAGWSGALGVPAVLGEGYTWPPLHSRFEEGPLGKAIFELGVQESVRCGLWGTMLTCTGAPHHPLWADVDWQRTWNEVFLAGAAAQEVRS